MTIDARLNKMHLDIDIVMLPATVSDALFTPYLILHPPGLFPPALNSPLIALSAIWHRQPQVWVQRGMQLEMRALAADRIPVLKDRQTAMSEVAKDVFDPHATQNQLYDDVENSKLSPEQKSSVCFALRTVILTKGETTRKSVNEMTRLAATVDAPVAAQPTVVEPVPSGDHDAEMVDQPQPARGNTSAAPHSDDETQGDSEQVSLQRARKKQRTTSPADDISEDEEVDQLQEDVPAKVNKGPATRTRRTISPSRTVSTRESVIKGKKRARKDVETGSASDGEDDDDYTQPAPKKGPPKPTASKHCGQTAATSPKKKAKTARMPAVRKHVVQPDEEELGGSEGAADEPTWTSVAGLPTGDLPHRYTKPASIDMRQHENGGRPELNNIDGYWHMADVLRDPRVYMQALEEYPQRLRLRTRFDFERGEYCKVPVTATQVCAGCLVHGQRCYSRIEAPDNLSSRTHPCAYCRVNQIGCRRPLADFRWSAAGPSMVLPSLCDATWKMFLPPAQASLQARIDYNQQVATQALVIASQEVIHRDFVNSSFVRLRAENAALYNVLRQCVTLLAQQSDAQIRAESLEGLLSLQKARPSRPTMLPAPSQRSSTPTPSRPTTRSGTPYLAAAHTIGTSTFRHRMTPGFGVVNTRKFCISCSMLQAYDRFRFPEIGVSQFMKYTIQSSLRLTTTSSSRPHHWTALGGMSGRFPHVMSREHVASHVVLDAADAVAITAVQPPVDVFWHNQKRLRNPGNWPGDCQWPAPHGDSVTGVFVVYASQSEPRGSIGRVGNVWLGPNAIWVMREQTSWVRWNKSELLPCPHDDDLVLTWSAHASFNYLAPTSTKTEARRWNKNGVPNHCISPCLRQSPLVQAALAKSYRDLVEEDIVLLLHARFQSARDDSAAVANRSAVVVNNEIRHNMADAGIPKRFSDVHPPSDGLNIEHKGTNHHQPDLGSAIEPELERRNVSAARVAVQTISSGHCKPSAQPMYPVFPRDKYACHWNDMDMFLPFSRLGSDQDPNIVMCRWMANNGIDATAATDDKLPLVTVLRTPHPDATAEEWREHVALAQHALCHGRVVAVLGATQSEAPFEWTEECISQLAGKKPDGAPIQWQFLEATENDYRTTSPQQPSADPSSTDCPDGPTGESSVDQTLTTANLHTVTGQREVDDDNTGATPNFSTVKGTICDFLAKLANPEERANCLDIPMVTSSVPYIIRALATSSHALNATANVGFSAFKEMPTATNSREFPTNPKKRKRSLHLQGTDSHGPAHMDWDVVRSATWGLVATAGAFTKAHHDAGGFLTWVEGKKRAKLWCYLVPTKGTQDVPRSLEDYRSLVDNWHDSEWLMGNATPSNVLLTPGTVLIQPPGTVHQVYTLDNSIFVGGHFLMLDAMHLTELTRASAALNAQAATNASHPGVLRLLTRIVICIAYERWTPCQYGHHLRAG
ncbi:hypothetical protein BC835DRAFT_1311501 [Cytidiella melzeri]|nr:hypothetical protein BC835DRAFT_1311501 [Cytidiella melzeri]